MCRCREDYSSVLWPKPSKFKGANGRTQRLKALKGGHPCNLEAD